MERIRNPQVFTDWPEDYAGLATIIGLGAESIDLVRPSGRRSLAILQRCTAA